MKQIHRVQNLELVASVLLFNLLIPAASIQTDFNVAGIFEPSAHTNTICEDLDSPAIFAKAVDFVNWLPFKRWITLQAQTRRINSEEGFLLSRYVCDHALKSMISASIGVKKKSIREYIQLVSELKQVPYLELSPSQDYSKDMVVHMHPDPQHLIDFTSLLITSNQKEWDWDNVFIVYKSTTELTRHLELLELHKRQEIVVNSYHMHGGSDYTPTFDYIIKLKSKQIIVDCDIASVKGFLNKALERQMLTGIYHYHFLSLDLHALDMEHYSYGGATITWAQIVNAGSVPPSSTVMNYEHYHKLYGTGPNIPKHYFTTHNALIVDSIAILAKAINTSLEEYSGFSTTALDCSANNSVWKNGRLLGQKLKETVEYDGMTGLIEFDSHGQRQNYTLYIMKLQPGGEATNIGNYTPPLPNTSGAVALPTYRQIPLQNATYSSTIRPLIVTTIKIDPFFMLKENHQGDRLVGNNQYEGYIVDLMNKIVDEAALLQIDLSYEFRIVADNEYGSFNEETQEWNGMVKEIVEGTADLAAAPLTINYEREQSIDFTKPFMTFGIAILYKVPEKAPPHLLTFMEPISLTVWGTIIASVVVVSFGMYIFSRFSPTEWENPFPCQENYGFLENQFNLSNAFWFSVGSIMQQGCDIMPKAPSTRIIAIAWWLFTLIIISSYTANLAAFLTITTLSDTFKSAEELEAQTEVTYGCKKNGNTCSFFENSKIPLYQRMWERISTSPDAFSSDTNEGIARVRDGNYAFLMESPYIQYNTNTDENCELTQVGPPINSLSYGIGLKTGHEYRDRLSSIILSLSEKQDLLELYNKWWKVNDNKCQQKEADDTNLQLKLDNLGGIFVFLIGGLGIAIVILCIEVLVYAVKRSKQDRMSTCEILSLWLKSSVKGTFPASTSNNSLDRYSMSLQGKMTLSSARPSITQAIKEEDEPQSEQTNKRQENTTTSIILTPSQI